jgi:hypothetical protein
MERVRPVTNQNHDISGQDRNARPVPVTPSSGTDRPEGLAFDVEEGTDLPGVPAGDQTAANSDAGHTEQTVRERGHGVGLEIPTKR